MQLPSFQMVMPTTASFQVVVRTKMAQLTGKAWPSTPQTWIKGTRYYWHRSVNAASSPHYMVILGYPLHILSLCFTFCKMGMKILALKNGT